jgi:hypothetical protein
VLGKTESDGVIIGRVLLKGKSMFNLRAEIEKNVTNMIEYVMEALPYNKSDLLAMPEDAFFMTVDRAREAYKRKANG